MGVSGRLRVALITLLLTTPGTLYAQGVYLPGGGAAPLSTGDARLR